jgi:hypothetical protein
MSGSKGSRKSNTGGEYGRERRILGYEGKAMDGTRNSFARSLGGESGYAGAIAWPAAVSTWAIRRHTVVTPLTCAV